MTHPVRQMLVNVKQYAMVAAGGLGLTGDRAPSGPLQAQIGINDPCNHKCVFCWDHPPDERENDDTKNRFGLARPGVMSLEQFTKIVDDLYQLGTRRIDLIGRGEPLLNRHALEMIRYVKARKMQLLLCSNASRLSEAIATGMVEAGLDRMNVSLNAGTPETYPHIHVTETPENYRRVKRNLRFLADCKRAAGKDLPYVSLSFVVNSKNFFEISQMVGVTGEVGAQEASFVHTTVHDGTPDLALSPTQYREPLDSIPRARPGGRAGCADEPHAVRGRGSRLPERRDCRASHRSLLRGLVLHRGAWQRLRSAVLSVHGAHRSGIEGAQLRRRLGVPEVRRLPGRSPGAPGAERPPQDLRVRPLPAPAAEPRHSQFPAPA